ncbi:hypothetical protein B0H19DRAFT_1335116, partial [Mycena capillaripes]
MEGMLIFVGLFSASLTAFVIESYKTLRPDSGDSAVQLLSQISQQLAAATNGSTFQLPATPESAPSPQRHHPSSVTHSSSSASDSVSHAPSLPHFSSNGHA